MFIIIRIVIIVLLEPSMMENYHLMHEIIGGITYWACLILVWLALNGPTEPEKAPAKERSLNLRFPARKIASASRYDGTNR